MTPPRGFPAAEFRARCARAQAMMGEAGLQALLLTTEPEIRYYTGFLTRFWESPTRPWFVVLPADGDPIAVIPAIGAPLMARTWVRDIRVWDAPDYEDDGVSLLTETLREVLPRGGVVGMADAMESHLRMPLRDFERLKAGLAGRTLASDGAITRTLRLVKSEAEIAKIRHAVGIAGRAFRRMGEIARVGVPLDQVFRGFQMLCLEEGADWVPYLAGAAGQGGYEDVISPATDAALAAGDVLMLDTGLVWDGYFCDFDRNWSLGPPPPEIAAAHARLIEATAAGFAAAQPGGTMADLFHAMDTVLGGGSRGRLGHGLGMQLTEWPSIIAADRTELRPGMVLTLEPVISLGEGRSMVHEENIVIGAEGPAWLSTPAGAEILRL